MSFAEICKEQMRQALLEQQQKEKRAKMYWFLAWPRQLRKRIEVTLEKYWRC